MEHDRALEGLMSMTAAPEPTRLCHLPPADLVGLAAATPPCLTMYLPTHRHAPDTTEDHTRLRGMIAAGRASLEELGLREDETSRILEPARRLLDRPGAFGRYEQSLALLLAIDRSHLFHLPYEVPELSIVGERFHLHPLAASLADEQVLLLTLTYHDARLFRVDRWAATEVEVPDLPGGLDDLLPDDDQPTPDKLRRAPAASGTAGFFHGHGGPKDPLAGRRRRYLSAVDRAIRPLVDRSRRALLVAGVRSLTSEFRSLGRRPIVGTIDGNPAHLSPEQLQAAAWRAAAPWLAAPRRAAVERLDDLAGTGLTADNPDVLLAYAGEGRIATLLLRDANDLAAAAPHVLARLDDVLLATLRHGGDAHLVEPGELRDGAVAAAILRY